MKYKEVSILQGNKIGWLKIFRDVYGYQKDKRKNAPIPQPYMVSRLGKPYVLILRYTSEVEELDKVKKGEVSWEDFRNEVLKKGFEQLTAGNTRVRPADVIGAEKVQTEKERIKLDTAGFMLEAAKYFQGNIYKCSHCGHEMLPQGLAQEELPTPLVYEQSELTDGSTE